MYENITAFNTIDFDFMDDCIIGRLDFPLDVIPFIHIPDEILIFTTEHFPGYLMPVDDQIYIADCRTSLKDGVEWHIKCRMN